MADKISELPAAAALDGTEVAWVEQGGLPKKATADEIAARGNAYADSTAAAEADAAVLEAQDYADTGDAATLAAATTHANDGDTAVLNTVSSRLSLLGKNLILNGDFRINQRDAATIAQSVGVYGYDRWMGHANGIEQVVEGDGLPAGNVTLSWQGGGTGYINGVAGASPFTEAVLAGTDIRVVVPATATNIQLELGDVATDFEFRPEGLELWLCQRYYEVIQGGQDTLYLVGFEDTFGNFLITQAWPFSARKRVVPAMSVEGQFTFRRSSSVHTASLAAIAPIAAEEGFRITYDLSAHGLTAISNAASSIRWSQFTDKVIADSEMA